MFVFVLLCILCVHSNFAIILKRKRKPVALLLLSYRCIVTINVLWLFLTVPWVGLQCVVVVVPDHTHLLFDGLGASLIADCKDSFFLREYTRHVSCLFEQI